MINKGYKFFSFFFSVLVAILFIASAYSNIPNTDSNPTTSLGPIAALNYTGSLSSRFAYNLLGEGGASHLRANGTAGYAFHDYNRFKISAEYLVQDITYAFFAGNSQQWVNQTAVGAGYQQDIPMRFSPQFDLSGYYSHAPSKTLSTVNGIYLNSFGLPIDFMNYRRIAGSHAAGGATGLSVHPWQSAKTGIYLNYDKVDYDQNNSVINEDALGFGGTAFYNQDLTDHVTLGLVGAIRQPFNNYRINLNWNNFHHWTIGAFGEYNVGKNTLPTTWNAGINLNYFADDLNLSNKSKNILSKKNKLSERMTPVQNNKLTKWVNEPAVRMPQVLAIVDEDIHRSQIQSVPCDPVTLITPFDSPMIIPSGNVFIEAAPHFSGQNLTYTLISGPSGISIDPNTGIISGFNNESSPPGTLTIVAAFNECTFAQGQFLIITQ